MSALLLAPHNDDETLFASFLCLRHQPHVIVCLRSFRMDDPHYPGGMAVDYRTRELETEFAMKTLGCSWSQLSVSDADPDWDLVWQLLVDYVDEERGAGRPERVFAPAREEGGHEQHDAIADIADEIFGDVTHYLTYTADGKSTSEHEVEYEPEWVAKKLHAMACYKSQAAHPATRKHFLDHGIREYLA